MRKRDTETEATARALMVLVRESRRATEAAERVDLVVRALAQRHSVSLPEIRQP